MEFTVWHQLLERSVETYFPTLKVKPSNPRSRKSVPFFPGYLFVRGSLENLFQQKIIWMPGTMSLVSFDGVPASISTELVEAIRHQVNQINTLSGQPAMSFRPGQPVWVDRDDLPGFMAIFEKCVNGQERVCVLLEMMRGRQVRVEVPLRSVRAMRTDLARTH